MIKTTWLHALMALLALNSASALAEESPKSLSAQIDALGPATQHGKDNDWRAQNEAEAAVARHVRDLIAARPGDPALTEVDSAGRTPLLKAALNGYAAVVEALLTDERVKDSVDQRDSTGLSPWMAAQFARPMTLASCHPQMLVREAYGLWRPNLRRIAYFQQETLTAFDRIRLALAAARATPDPDAAKRYWLEQCPGHDPALEPDIAASGNLLATLMADTDKRLTAFFAELKGPPSAGLRAGLPAQPLIREIRRKDPPITRAELTKAAVRWGMVCTVMPKIDLADIGPVSWSGEVTFQLKAEVQDGVPVAAIVTTDSGPMTIQPAYSMRFRAAVYKALGGYRCPGDHVFEQQFRFTFTQ